MPVPSSGAISLNDFHVEAGGTSGTQCSLNDADIRGLISKGSGSQMSFNEWYGATASDLTANGTAGINTVTINIGKGTSTYSFIGIGTGTYSSVSMGSWTDQTMSGTNGAFNLIDIFTDNSTTPFAQFVISGTGSIGSTFSNWTGYRYIKATGSIGTNVIIFDSNLASPQGGTLASGVNGTTWSHSVINQMPTSGAVTLTLSN